ncbi:MAG: hypothetical protein ACE14V_04980 [bacterium]
MFRLLKLIHFIGMILMLGSIFTFVLISVVTKVFSPDEPDFGRIIIAFGTYLLTFPGIWLLVLSGIWMGYIKYGFKSRFVQIKFILGLLIILNGYLFVLPAVKLATTLAMHGQISSAYHAAYMQESSFGAINVLIAIIAAIVGIWRIGDTKSKKD